MTDGAIHRPGIEGILTGTCPKVRKARRVRTLFWVSGLAMATLQAWAFRHIVSPDAISYLDIARSCASGHWKSLVNGYWSPLYPFFVSLALRAVRPSPYWESTVAHFANVGIFVISFLCFEFLLSMLVREHKRIGNTEEQQFLSEWAIWLVGDSLFVFYALLFNSVSEITPDLLLAGLVFLAAGFLVRVRARDARWWTYSLLGATLGVSYLAKAVMFPLSFVFLGCCLFAARPFRKSALRTALALISFAVVAAPFLSALSHSKGRLTFGDTGKIAYAEFVDGATHYVNWQGGPAGVGRPAHPTREVLSHPPLFVFAGPVKGTYPPWYDPSYWYEGIVPAFRLKNQLRAIHYTIQEYAGIIPYMSPVLVALLSLAFLADSGRSVARDLLHQWPLWVPAAAGLGIYALVYVEARLVAPFFVLLWVSLLAGLRFPKADTGPGLERHVCLALATVLLLGVGWLAARSLFRSFAPKPFINWQVAEGLHERGIQSGDRIASMGDSLKAYWAHLAGVRIVAEIPMASASEYWSASPQVKSEILTDFAKAGAEAVVTDQEPPNGPNAGWQRIGQTIYFMHDLRQNATGHENKP